MPSLKPLVCTLRELHRLRTELKTSTLSVLPAPAFPRPCRLKSDGLTTAALPERGPPRRLLLPGCLPVTHVPPRIGSALSGSRGERLGWNQRRGSRAGPSGTFLRALLGCVRSGSHRRQRGCENSGLSPPVRTASVCPILEAVLAP